MNSQMNLQYRLACRSMVYMHSITVDYGNCSSRLQITIQQASSVAQRNHNVKNTARSRSNPERGDLLTPEKGDNKKCPPSEKKLWFLQPLFCDYTMQGLQKVRKLQGLVWEPLQGLQQVWGPSGDRIGGFGSSGHVESSHWFAASFSSALLTGTPAATAFPPVFSPVVVASPVVSLPAAEASSVVSSPATEASPVVSSSTTSVFPVPSSPPFGLSQRGPGVRNSCSMTDGTPTICLNFCPCAG